MGSQYMEGILETGIMQKMALEIHLRNNHYPPVSTAWIEPCQTIIKAVTEAIIENDGVPNEIWETEIDNPVKKGQTCTYGMVYEALHLNSFVDHALSEAGYEAH